MKFGSQSVKRMLKNHKEICRPTGRSLGPVLKTVDATRALEESKVSDSNLAATSPPRAGKLQTLARRDLDA